MKRMVWNLSRTKKALLAIFLLAFVLSFIGLLWNFYQENTVAFAGEGGRFTEGAVAVIDQNFTINPLLVTGTSKATSVEADISRLVFAGLMKFDPESGDIVDHLATHTLSPDKKTYTFTLKDGLKWHDGEALTADDVIFTYHTLLQNPEFPNPFLRQAFSDVTITKLDEKSVTFTLSKPYKFFLTNFTVGLVPQHLLSDIPVANMQYAEFNQMPVGAGPYRVSGVSYGEGSPIATVSLEAFTDYAGGKPKISLFEFELFPNNDLLVQNLSHLDSLRAKLSSEYEFLRNGDPFRLVHFTIPQYAAVFINMQSQKLGGEVNQKVRWALQLGTDKDEMLKTVEGKRIDTPLLETDTSAWLFEFDPEKAAGALKDAGWYLPGSVPQPEENTQTPESAEETTPADSAETADKNTTPTEKRQFISGPSSDAEYWTTNGTQLITGTVPADTTTVKVNGYQLKLFSAAKGTFSYRAETGLGTLKKGENVYTVEFLNANGDVLANEKLTIHLVESLADIPTPETTAPATNETETSAENTTPENSENTEAPSEEATPPEENIAETPGDPNIRVNTNGEPLTLKLVTIESPAFYPQLAEILRQQWAKIGINLEVEVLNQETFIEKAIKNKDYDLLLYGQNLGYNLDAFPFWHSSQAESGANLSKYKSFAADVLLEEIRQTHDEDVRQKKLADLREIIKNDVPAVFLLSPQYTMPISSKVHNLTIDHIALLPDRFGNAEWWYIKESRSFKEDKSWFSFFPWFFSSIFSVFS